MRDVVIAAGTVAGLEGATQAFKALITGKEIFHIFPAEHVITTVAHTIPGAEHIPVVGPVGMGMLAWKGFSNLFTLI
jgi:hypothetical protein